MKKYIKKYKKLILNLFFSMILSFILIITSAIGLYTLGKQEYFNSISKEVKIEQNELTTKGYVINGNEYIAKDNDPYFEIKNNNKIISSISIKLSEKLQSNIDIQVYYNVSNRGYNEKDSIRVTMKKGRKNEQIYICKKNVSSIRIDVGNAKNVNFYLRGFIINQKTNMTIIDRIIDQIASLNFGRIGYQCELLAAVLFFLGLHVCYNIKHLYQKIFKHRWIIAAVILTFFVGNKFNGESIGVYNDLIQPGSGNEYIEPIFGTARAIRSDEYVVETPSKMASIHDGNYGKYNEIARGTKTLNSINGIYIGYSSIGHNPFQIVYKILPAEYAYSFCWYAPIILCYMVAIELFYIIGKRNKLLAVTGASIEVLSPFYMWWGFPSFILGAQSAIVCFYYFIQNDSLKKKILFGFGLAMSFAYFVLTLYPAWIVPMGYISLCFVIWITYENWDKIKDMDIKSWLVIFIMGLFSISLIVSYLILNKEYLSAITNTVYPGARRLSGDFSIYKIFYYIQSYMYAFKDTINPSETGVVACLFPIPMILAGYKCIKSEKRNYLLIGLMIVSVIFIIFTTIGLPKIIAQMTLLSLSTGSRTVDILAITQIYLLVISLSEYEDIHINKALGIVIAFFSTIIGIYFCWKYQTDYLSKVTIIITFIVLFSLMFILMCYLNKKTIKLFCVFAVVFSIITSTFIRPISKGFDPITSKPVSMKIQQIIKNDSFGKWISYDAPFQVSGFLIANGASTLNSTNTYPNLKLWRSLDPKNKYEKVYNRYAHVGIDFTSKDTSFEIGGAPDCFNLHLSYKDMKKINVKYVFSLKRERIKNKYFYLKELYGENGSFIYEVIYN